MPRGRHGHRHFRREGFRGREGHFRGREGHATATINNTTEFEGPFVAGSTSVTISIMGGVNVNAHNEGSANAFNHSRGNSTTNDA